MWRLDRIGMEQMTGDRWEGGRRVHFQNSRESIDPNFYSIIAQEKRERKKEWKGGRKNGGKEKGRDTDSAMCK